MYIYCSISLKYLNIFLFLNHGTKILDTICTFETCKYWMVSYNLISSYIYITQYIKFYCLILLYVKRIPRYVSQKGTVSSDWTYIYISTNILTTIKIWLLTRYVFHTYIRNKNYQYKFKLNFYL